MWDGHKEHWHLRGHNLPGTIERKHTTRHSGSWGKQEGQKENNQLLLARAKALLQGFVYAQTKGENGTCNPNAWRFGALWRTKDLG